jgi:hypothetical protein
VSVIIVINQCVIMCCAGKMRKEVSALDVLFSSDCTMTALKLLSPTKAT